MYEFKIGRRAGKTYEAFSRQMTMYAFLLDNTENCDAEPMWPKQNPYIRKEKNMTYYEFMENEITALRAELKAANARIEELTKQNEEFETALADAEERNNVKDAYIDELRMKLESVVSRNKEDKIHVAKLEGIAAGATVLKQENAILHKCVDRLNEELAEVKERNENQYEMIEQLSRELKDYKAVCGDNPEAMAGYIRETDERICKLRNDNKLLEMAMMDATTNVNVISGENKRLRAQNEKYDLVIHTIEQLFGCAFDI